jgi:hypothetical protein
MGVLELADMLEITSITFNDEAAAMLRKQHAAIQQLREAAVSVLWYTDQLEMLVYSSDQAGDTHELVAKMKAALAATEDVCANS